MDIIVINKTRVSSKRLKEIIDFVRPKKTILPKIIVRNVKSFCFNGAYSYNGNIANNIYTSVGPYDNFPALINRAKRTQRIGYLSGFILKNKEECLVYLLAHETRHAFQHQNPDAPRLGYKNRYQLFSETDADTYALKKLEAWRKRKRILRSNVIV